MWYEFTELKCVSQEPWKKFSVSYWIFFFEYCPCDCNFLKLPASSERYIRKVPDRFSKVPGQIVLLVFYPLFQWVKSTYKKKQWNNKSIYTHMFSVKLQLIVILFCYEVYSKVFLNPKRGILYHKRGANEKANTHGLHLLRGGFWWSTRKWKANKEIKTVYTSEKLYLLKTEMFTDLNVRPLITIYEFLEKKSWNMTWAWIWKPCRENVFYNKTKCNR